MKQVSVIISTYTADVSGVCSALYELGGMVVIHDPSGCNSTYNTHDEPRWYEQDSLIFISGLSEIDAIMGNDEKFIDDVIRAAKDLSPKFIALVRSPIPLMIGTDFDAIGDVIEQETGIPVFYFPTDGMHSYVQGVDMALAAVAEHMVREPDRIRRKEAVATEVAEEKCMAKGITTEAAGGEDSPLRINLLGVTPLDFSINGTLSSMQACFVERNCEIISTFAMGSRPQDIARAGEAEVNVVVSSAGLSAAKVLFRRFGTPYVVGMPTGAFAQKVLADVEQARTDGLCRVSYQNRDRRAERTETETDSLYLIGETVIAQSLAAAIRRQYGVPVTVLCPLETETTLFGDGCRRVESEEEIAEAVKRAAGVIADPMYQPVCPEDMPFFPLPHEAFSGRIYRRQIPDLTTVDFLGEWLDELTTVQQTEEAVQEKITQQRERTAYGKYL